MAAKVFAKMSHRDFTNKITLVLTYAVLEWVLVILLLLSSLFSYLIVKFAGYFGLQRPCLWCSRLDHIFESEKSNISYRDLVCEAHAKEISHLGYCLDHKKLSKSEDMCESCFSTLKPDDHCEFSKKFDFFPWMNQIGVVEGGEEILKCSCCGEILNYQFATTCVLIKSSWEDFEYTQKHNFVTELAADIDQGNQLGQISSELAKYLHDDDEHVKGKGETRIVYEDDDDDYDYDDDDDGVLEGREYIIENDSTCSVCEFGCKDMIKVHNVSASIDNQARKTIPQPQHLEFYIDSDDCRLIPIELTGFAPKEMENRNLEKEDEEDDDDIGEDVILDFDVQIENPIQPTSQTWLNSGQTIGLLSVCRRKEDYGFHDTPEKTQEMESNVHQDFHTNNVDIEAKTFIETEIALGEIRIGDGPSPYSSVKQPKHDMHDFKQSENEEELVDGSITSEIENGEGNLSVERLKSLLTAQRKALNGLYAELEEERSASEVAANQTMAMINRLQEEKAIMKMEALHYQRMMEEQFEYDQEALQLLNEFVVKRETEKRETENELEIYRRKVEDYEAKEKMTSLRNMNTRSSPNSYSNSDELSVNFNGIVSENQEQYFEEFFHEQNENGYDDTYDLCGNMNGIENGHHKETNGKHHHQVTRRMMNSNGNTLLPLLDEAAESESEYMQQFDSVVKQNPLSENKKLAVVEEVDQVYKRLQHLNQIGSFLIIASAP